jgi:hypothetical protein
MKTILVISLCPGIAAALAGIVWMLIKIHKTGKADKWAVVAIISSLLFILFAAINLFYIIPRL